MPERYAIYYAPPVTSALWERATQWLGRDAATGENREAAIAGVGAARRFEVTRLARRYGFHATMKPPMVMPGDRTYDELDRALAGFCAPQQPVPIGRLAVRQIGDFLALIPVEQPQALTDLAAETTTAFEPFRAPLDAADRQRRLSADLTTRQIELLDQYGYPYVLEQFKFHMTIGDPLIDDDRDDIVAAAQVWFAPVLAEPVTVDRLVVFHEAEAGVAFNRLPRDYVLAGGR